MCASQDIIRRLLSFSEPLAILCNLGICGVIIGSKTCHLNLGIIFGCCVYLGLNWIYLPKELQVCFSNQFHELISWAFPVPQNPIGFFFFLFQPHFMDWQPEHSCEIVLRWVLLNPIDSVTNKSLWVLGAVSIRKTVLPGMAIPMLKIRRPNGRLIFNMEITIRR